MQVFALWSQMNLEIKRILEIWCSIHFLVSLTGYPSRYSKLCWHLTWKKLLWQLFSCVTDRGFPLAALHIIFFSTTPSSTCYVHSVWWWKKKKKSKVPRLCFLILHWEGLALRKHLITKIFSSEEKQPHNLKKKNNCRYFLEQSHNITVTSILLGTWAYKTSATLSNGVRKIPDSWTKAATLFTCQLLWAINWQVWSLGLTFSANSTMLVGQIAASISDFLRVLTQLLNFIIASYHQQIKRQQIIGYRLPVLHSFPLPLEIELLWCNLGQVIPYIHLKIIQGSSH